MANQSIANFAIKDQAYAANGAQNGFTDVLFEEAGNPYFKKSLNGQFSGNILDDLLDPAKAEGKLIGSITNVVKNTGTGPAESILSHEYTHGLMQLSDYFREGDVFPRTYANNMSKNINEFQTIAQASISNSENKVGGKLFHIGEEALDISTYSRRIEENLYRDLTTIVAEEARAETGANLINRLAYGQHYNSRADDSIYHRIGGFESYVNSKVESEVSLRLHPYFQGENVPFGERGGVLFKSLEDIPEKLAELGRVRDDIALRVDMKLNASFMGQLGEFGESYSRSSGGMAKQIMGNMEEIYDRAFAIHNSHEKAREYTLEYANHMFDTSQASRGVGMEISTISGKNILPDVTRLNAFDMPTLSNRVSTTNALGNIESRTGVGVREIAEKVANARFESYNPVVSIGTGDLKAAIAAARESTEKVGALASEVVEAGGKGMVRRTLGGILEAGETAAKVMRFTR
jgi:hypothetical protein